MRAVVQRVTEGTVTVEDQVTGSIESGYVVLLGVEDTDTEKDADYLAEKIVGLRIFEDADGKMNLSLQDTGGQMLVISQFTLLADARKGRRPNFVKAAKPELAKKLYDYFVSKVKSMGVTVEEGIFQTHMLVRIYNDGPVTILLDSNKLF
ncbi:MAG: D-aminoacyl-tRNA deacylase [Firmicutes bacterium]|nr:D-aminoacyl-tRNA deacylase [Bacillota bacterium]MDD7601938.1 D-aminoacyl-tRNA deacylase [Bacillota bacterium]MDY5855954.1 D-aminoacyl-tRNA deacylase [Anaerovoracaceae bacterium]